MVTISLKLSAGGSWNISRCDIQLFSDLPLGAAIKLAREMARDEYQRSKNHISVEMPGPTSAIVLARYTDSDGASADITLAA